MRVYPQALESGCRGRRPRVSPEYSLEFHCRDPSIRGRQMRALAHVSRHAGVVRCKQVYPVIGARSATASICGSDRSSERSVSRDEAIVPPIMCYDANT